MSCQKNCKCCNIEVTQERFLYLAEQGKLKSCQTYKITDIQNGLFVTTITNSTFSPEASLSFLAPDYTLHEQYHYTDGALANNAIVTWGGFYWQNTSGGSATPDLPSEANISTTGFTKITKSVANGYVQILLNVMVTESLFVFYAKDENGNEVKVNEVLNSLIGFNPIDVFQWNDQRIFNHSVLVSNNKLTQANCTVYDCKGDFIYEATNKIASVSQNLLTNSTYCAIFGTSSYFGSKIYRNTLSGIGASINTINQNSRSLVSGNVLSGIQTTIEGYYQTSLCRITNNVLSGNPSTNGTVTIAYGRQDDDCEIDGNILSGDGAQFFDNHQHEACSINGNTLSGNNTRLSHVVQYKTDECNDNTISADDEMIDLIFQDGNENKLNDCTITAGKSIRNIRMSKSEITNSSVKLSEINVQGIDINLTGFTQPIYDEDISANVGTFAIEHDFTASPLNSGSSVYYNIIPNGARITNITTVGNATGGAGAQLAFGLESDAPNLLAAAVLATVNAGQFYNNISTQATANRSLQIAASVANVTGGSVTVKVEFVL